MDEETLANARKEYQHILQGRAGRWFDPGEYEQLKQQWFDKYGMKLIEALEKKNTQERREEN